MSDNVTVELKGLAKLTGRMKKLDMEVLEQILPGALAEVGEQGRQWMAEAAPKYSGLLRSSFDAKVGHDEKAHIVTVYIGPNSKTVYPPGHDKHGLGKTMTAKLVAGWIEFGHRLADAYKESDYTIKGLLKKGRRRRASEGGRQQGMWVPAVPFMRLTRDKIKTMALAFIAKKIKEVLDRQGR